jgi:hypothetical protein
MKNGLIIDKYGTCRYYKDDLLHREDGPAIEYADGSKWWCLNGEIIDCQSNEEFLKLVKWKSFW